MLYLLLRCLIKTFLTKTLLRLKKKDQGRKEYTTYYAINPQIVRKKSENKK